MRLVISAVLLFLPAILPAQTVAQRRAAATITEADVRSRIFIIAHDSMGGRNTPSPGLEKTANYVASEFKRLGLKPGGDSGTFLQRYPIRQTRIDTSASEVAITTPEGRARLGLARDAAFFFGAVKSGRWPVVLVGGPLDSANPNPGAFRGKAAIWFPDPKLGLQAIRQSLRFLTRGGAEAVLIATGSDSLVNAQIAAQGRTRQTVGEGTGVTWILARGSVLTGQLPQAREAVEQVQNASAFTARPLDGWNVTLSLEEQVLQEVKVPNTVGVLEGTDPQLKNEYIVFSAHMDHVGLGRPPQNQSADAPVDTIFNGADDDASGTVGIIELAEAFAQPGARPKRSLIFLTVSGEEHGLWGSEWFAKYPPVPIDRIVANLNADMIGRNWKDTIVVIGKEHSDLGQTLARVNQEHPELNMTAIDDPWPEQSFYTRSDHFNFARRGVPVLFFFNGTHADYHRPSDEPEKIDAEKEARIVQLMFWLATEIGNATERPKWDPASYAKYVSQP